VPLKALITGKFDNITYERSMFDLIFYCFRNILDGVLALVLLYMGYALAMKMRKAKSKDNKA